jgi:endonuclease YncB( thermonuclease family)
MKKIITITYFIFISTLFIFFNSYAFQSTIRTVTGTVTKVSDGDTIHLTTPEQTKLKVRLYGLDAPETDKMNNKTGKVNIPGQPYGDESWKALENKVMGKQVKLDILDIDKYRRMVGMIYLNDRNINLEMIREGYAEAFIEYLKEPYRSEFLKVEKEARSMKRGIWSLPIYERHREFRKRLKVRVSEQQRIY